MAPSTSSIPETLSVERIRQRLTARTVGRQICLYPEVPSTNAVLRDMARAGAPEGTVVLAESQTAGRGRGGKPWFSPSGVNLYALVLLRPRIPAKAAPVFSFIASLALADTIVGIGLPAAIKWPNDVLVEGKKVGGVLVELATSGDALEHVILGVGVNLNVERAALRAALGEPAGQAAGSLREALGREIDRNAFAAAFLTFLDRWLTTYQEVGEAPVLRAWRDRDILTGRRVEVRDGAVSLDGRAVGVDADGHLQALDSRGRVFRVLAGEVRIVE